MYLMECFINSILMAFGILPEMMITESEALYELSFASTLG